MQTRAKLGRLPNSSGDPKQTLTEDKKIANRLNGRIGRCMNASSKSTSNPVTPLLSLVIIRPHAVRLLTVAVKLCGAGA